jgi:uncharacterized membrane protein YGL010W
MRKVDQLLTEYGESHQNPTNKKIHWVCVPLIAFSVLGLLWSIPHGYFAGVLPGVLEPYANWATIVAVLATLYYLRLSFSLFAGMALFSALFLYLARLIDISPAPLWAVSVGIFVGAWIVQFIGHEIEGKKPSFFKDVQFLLIGPAWLLHFLYRKLGIAY